VAARADHDDHPVRLVLLGMPVAHSLSPRIHTAALQACGVAGEYQAREVDTAGFTAAVAQLEAGELDGANVTMPHKRAAHAACTTLHRDAHDAGSVNTLAMREGVLAGWCTDVAAVRRALAAMPAGPVLILGGGGAAAAAAVAATGREEVAISTRREGGPVAVLESGTQITWGTTVPGAVVVNATPLGMAGETLPAGVLEVAAGLVDLAYGQDPTPAVGQAARAGIPWVDGIQILVDQAAESFEIWTGLPAPREVMTTAARGPMFLKGA
jgi:shikimate dehydrogenase